MRTSKSKAKTIGEALGISPEVMLAMLDHFNLGLKNPDGTDR
jgi:hypothetical protein